MNEKENIRPGPLIKKVETVNDKQDVIFAENHTNIDINPEQEKPPETIKNNDHHLKVSGDENLTRREVKENGDANTETKDYRIIRPLSVALEEAKNRPPLEYLWFGIPNSTSVTLVVAAPKIGKTTYAENLAYHLASKTSNEYLGFQILNNRRVALLSLEEAEVNRTNRQLKQIENLGLDIDHIINNIHVLSASFHQFLSTDKQRQELIDLLRPIQPDVIIIDSLSRLYMGIIESSEHSQQLMAFVRSIANTFQVPVIILHHLVKTKNKDSIELSSMAGSRIIAQECEGVISITKDDAGIRKLQGLAWRYYAENEEDVRYFKIDSNCLIEQVINSTLSQPQSKIPSKEILDRILKKSCTMSTAELLSKLVDSGEMGRSTMFDAIRLNDKIESIGNGIWRHKECSTHSELINLIDGLDEEE